jgi:3-isopropylmalate/(R)-2-methylmalate dehydratase large subunit
MSPVGSDWEEAVGRWRALPSDADAEFDKTVDLSADGLQPMVTFGTNPGMVIPVNDPVPDAGGDPGFRKALDYMQLLPGKPLSDTSIDVVFVGSCTNSRLSDLQSAADVLRDRKIASGVRMLVVPGSQRVKREAESIGLDEVFKSAGAEWRESGCSMCLAMNNDSVPSGKLCVSTSNRNFEGRQGIGSRTILASPMTAAASAVEGRVADPRNYL